MRQSAVVATSVAVALIGGHSSLLCLSFNVPFAQQRVDLVVCAVGHGAGLNVPGFSGGLTGLGFWEGGAFAGAGAGRNAHDPKFPLLENLRLRLRP